MRLWHGVVTNRARVIEQSLLVIAEAREYRELVVRFFEHALRYGFWLLVLERMLETAVSGS